jgi:acetyl esterase
MSKTLHTGHDLSDPGIRRFLQMGEAFYPADAVTFSMAEQRAFYDRYCAHFRKPRGPGLVVSDGAVGPVLVRHYQPEPKGPRPIVLYLHGGGFVLGGLESHDDICAELCVAANVAVVAVQYRLAPEHPFPAAFDDCWQVLQHLARNNPEAGLVVAGDSAGGNLAAALALRARDEGGPRLQGQVLIYPGLGGDMATGSYLTQAHAPGLSTADVIYYRDVYGGASHKYAEPLRETSFAGLPPAFLVAAHHDPLHDDGPAYAARLQAVGVAALVREEPQLVHAFLRARHMSVPAAKSFSAIVGAIHELAYHARLPSKEIP